MVGFLIRYGVLLAVVFGLAYGVARAVKIARHENRLKKIERDVRALQAGLEQGLYNTRDYDHLTQDISDACKRAGVTIPAFPKRLPEAREGTTPPAEDV